MSHIKSKIFRASRRGLWGYGSKLGKSRYSDQFHENDPFCMIGRSLCYRLFFVTDFITWTGRMRRGKKRGFGRQT